MRDSPTRPNRRPTFVPKFCEFAVVVFGQSPLDSWFRRDTECVEMSGLGVTSTVRAMLASPSPGCWSADAVWRGVPQAAGYGIRRGDEDEDDDG